VHLSTKNVFIITDLEGAAGVTRFEQASGKNHLIEQARKMLTAELNAVIRGINDFDPVINIHVWDGHGAGGIDKADLLPVAKYLPPSRMHVPRYFKNEQIDALLFVGQHAMSNTPGANLCHTMSHEAVDYYKLNGITIGEFGLWAAVAGEIGVPTIYLSGDDKACEEASWHIPGIVTTAVKTSTGLETATDLPLSLERLHHDVQKALRTGPTLKPFTLGKPVALEIALKHGFRVRGLLKKGAERHGHTAAVFRAPSLEDLIDKEII